MGRNTRFTKMYTSAVTTDIKIIDICGFWEVIRICEGDNILLYPWLRKRFKLEFLDNMIFSFIRDGQHFRGNWELKKKVVKNKMQFSIILNGIVEYIIVEISEDEITLSDHITKYLLVKRY